VNRKISHGKLFNGKIIAVTHNGHNNRICLVVFGLVLFTSQSRDRPSIGLERMSRMDNIAQQGFELSNEEA
jgi:hypothetical protein